MRPWIIAACVVGVFVVVGIAALAYAFTRYATYYAQSNSMAPTIPENDTFLADRYAYRSSAPQRGDIVVFVPPLAGIAMLFKRVIAVPGDHVAIERGRLMLNGKPVAEPYLRKPTAYSLTIHDRALWIDGEPPALNAPPPANAWTAPDTVPKGCYVVLGDNRNSSEDSHAFGFLCPGNRGSAPAAKLIGRALR